MADAKELLENLYKEYESSQGAIEDIESERDNQVLAYSLLGFIKKEGKTKDDEKFDFKEQIEGLKLQQRAQELSSEIPGGAVMYERKKWLIIPDVTSQDIFH